jgi:hypothetical protein
MACSALCIQSMLVLKQGSIVVVPVAVHWLQTFKRAIFSFGTKPTV